MTFKVKINDVISKFKTYIINTRTWIRFRGYIFTDI